MVKKPMDKGMLISVTWTEHGLLLILCEFFLRSNGFMAHNETFVHFCQFYHHRSAQSCWCRHYAEEWKFKENYTSISYYHHTIPIWKIVVEHLYITYFCTLLSHKSKGSPWAKNIWMRKGLNALHSTTFWISYYPCHEWIWLMPQPQYQEILVTV